MRNGPAADRRRRWGTAIVRAVGWTAAIGAAAGRPTAATAQIKIQVQAQPLQAVPGVGSATDETSLVPPQDRDAETWLKRAADAAEREDWKLAADTLARVIAEHGHKIVSLDEGKSYQSAISCVQRQIGSWPPAGLAAYRVLYDGEAQRLMDAALATHDVEPLKTIVHKYPHTTQGPRAMELLAAWAIDAGLPTEALDALDRLVQFPDQRVPAWRALELRAIAQASANLIAAANDTLETLRKWQPAEGQAAPKDLAARVDRIAKYVEESSKTGIAQAAWFGEPWTGPLGPAGGHGRTADVMPVITPQVPWRDSLPGVERIDPTQALRIIDRSGRPPVWGTCSDGRLIFTATPAGIVARDLATFDLVWQSVPPATGSDARVREFRIRTGMFNAGVPEDNKQRLDEITTRALFQEYAGAISVGHGLVFTIEQPVNPGERRPTKEGDPEPLPLMESQVQANSLRAFKADTGLSAWTVGASGSVADDLREAHFYSTPVVVGPYLLASYEQRQDFGVVVLTPEGKVVRKVALGTGRPLMFPINSVLPPTVADGTVYVPTGAGLLVALNATDFSLRWLAQYPRLDEVTGARQGRRNRNVFMFDGVTMMSQADGWLGSPPVVVGGLVLLAPQDGAYLFALDRADGSIKWKTHRGRHRYIVGADETRVIVAGQEIAAFKLTDGSPDWEYNDAAGASTESMPSGRPVYAGSRVLVPTETGLLALDAATGKPVGDKRPYDEPLGNLSVAEGALYSVSPTTMVKFPDVEWTRKRANERLAEDPGDWDAVMRLAWLAALDNDWGKSLAILDSGLKANAERNRQSDPGTLDRVGHLRTTALLKLAEAKEGAERLALLEQAGAAARQPSDVVEAGLALADQQAEGGEYPQAFARAVAMLAAVGRQPVGVEPGLNGRAAIVIGDRLRRFYGELLTDALKADAAKAVADALEKVTDEATRRTMVDALGFMPDAARLDLETGRKLQAAREIESAAYYFDRAARRSTDDQVSAAAKSGSAEAMAAEPSDVSGPSGQNTAGLSRGDSRLRLLDQNIETNKVQTRMFHTAVGAAGFGEVVPVRFNRNLFGVATRGPAGEAAGRPAWSTAVAPSPDAIEATDVNIFNVPPLPNPRGESAPAAVAGRIAVMDCGTSFQAVGLATGRCMWRPLAIDRSRGDLPEPSVVAAGGIVVMAADANTLVAVPARDGAEPIWTRDFGRIRLAQLAVVNGKVAVIDHNAKNLYLLEPESGRIARQFSFIPGPVAPKPSAEPEGDDPDAHVVIVGGTACRANEKTVVGRDVATGRTLWEVPLKARVKGLHVLDGDHVGVTYRGDRFMVVRADNGEVVKELTIDDLSLPPLEVILEGRTGGNPGRLLMFSKTDDDPPEYKLAQYPLDGREPSFQGPWAHATVTRRMLTQSPDSVAVIRYDKRTGQEDDVQFGGQQVRVINGQVQIINGPDMRGVRAAGLWVYDKNKELERIGKFEFDSGDPNDNSASIFNLAGLAGSQVCVTDVVQTPRGLIVVGPFGYCVLGKGEGPATVSKSGDGAEKQDSAEKQP